jgi:hypothetical protein
MADDNPKQSRAQRNREPKSIDTTLTGNHPTGNYRNEPISIAEQAPRIEATGVIWIEQDDQAKQGMARKTDLKDAQAAPGHPHIGHQAGSGESQ